jgi:hypothetical protein
MATYLGFDCYESQLLLHCSTILHGLCRICFSYCLFRRRTHSKRATRVGGCTRFLPKKSNACRFLPLQRVDRSRRCPCRACLYTTSDSAWKESRRWKLCPRSNFFQLFLRSANYTRISLTRQFDRYTQSRKAFC